MISFSLYTTLVSWAFMSIMSQNEADLPGVEMKGSGRRQCLKASHFQERSAVRPNNRIGLHGEKLFAGLITDEKY
jgi:hypothetical protein